jgi:hypothetical protein
MAGHRRLDGGRGSEACTTRRPCVFATLLIVRELPGERRGCLGQLGRTGMPPSAGVRRRPARPLGRGTSTTALGGRHSTRSPAVHGRHRSGSVAWLPARSAAGRRSAGGHRPPGPQDGDQRAGFRPSRRAAGGRRGRPRLRATDPDSARGAAPRSGSGPHRGATPRMVRGPVDRPSQPADGPLTGSTAPRPGGPSPRRSSGRGPAGRPATSWRAPRRAWRSRAAGWTPCSPA